MKRKPLKIPVHPKPMIMVYEDGREVCLGQAWADRKVEVWELDERRCVVCHRSLLSPLERTYDAAQCHHIHGRGMAGGKRDDRIFVNGERNLNTLCWACHAKSKIERFSIKYPERKGDDHE